MPKKEIKMSSLDRNAPPGVEVMIRIQLPGGPRRPPVKLADYTWSQWQKAQDHLNVERHAEYMTWWRKDGLHVHKWPTMMQGKRRHFRVSVPYRPGVSDGRWKEVILEGVFHYAEEVTKDDIKVVIDDARNREEKAELVLAVSDVQFLAARLRRLFANFEHPVPEVGDAELIEMAGTLVGNMLFAIGEKKPAAWALCSAANPANVLELDRGRERLDLLQGKWKFTFGADVQGYVVRPLVFGDKVAIPKPPAVQ